MIHFPDIKFNRVYYIAAGLVILWVLLEIRLFKIQILQHNFYVEQSQQQSAKKIQLTAQRGEIFDRNGACLATNLIQYDFGVDLSRVESRELIAQKFAIIFDKPKSIYLKKMQTDRDFVFLERKVPEALALKVDRIVDAGLVKIEGSRRYYPFGRCGSQVIGFTDVDDKGATGLELQYQQQLAGKDGWTYLTADARRRFGYNVDLPHEEPQAGINLHLTIEKDFQTIVEEELDHGVRTLNARSGIAILMNPNSGEILAMYSSPGYDPNDPSRSQPEERKNRAIMDIFEPGSTFKIFPAAALLQEGLKKPTDMVYCENGTYRVYSHNINDHQKYGWLSFRKVIQNSSNIGIAKLTVDLPKNLFYKYLKNFGFDSPTGIDLDGEASGLLTKPEKFSGLSKAVISFGQEVGVTAIQIVTAYAAVINGGNLPRPFVIQKAVDENGDVIFDNETRIVRQVLNKNVSQTLKEFMLDVVQNGTGRKATIPGVQVGGKTGTAQKYDRQTNQYILNNYLASFIGFAPYDNPEFVLGIFIDAPRQKFYGGDVAAPVFAAIMSRILGFTPHDEAEPEMTDFKITKANPTIPNLQGFPFSAIEEYLEIKDVDYIVQGEGTHVLSQTNSDDELKLVLGTPEIKEKVFPDLRGMTLRECIQHIDFSKIRVRIIGKGKVVEQSIRPGTVIGKGSELVLTCSQ
jgi:cell division protein FtsI (penicillin-binding protein 3)